MEERSYVSREPILKGWSGDKKYRVTDKEGNAFLLRISSQEQYARKKQEFDLMVQVDQLGVPMCRPLELGVCQEGVYSLQSWIDGMDAEEVLPSLSAQQQYAYGLEAGRILRKIHQIPAPKGTEDWEIFFNRKIDRKIRMYEDCPLKYAQGQCFLDYIADHRQLLRDRPRTYQHGDYHTGNMMLGRDGKLYIIDFNRCDFGDPWEEFNRIVWCAQTAPRFAAGMVDGYFDGNIPQQFWELLALYISSNTLSSLPWAIPFGEGEIKVMVDQARDILSWYDKMTNPIPSWYRA